MTTEIWTGPDAESAAGETGARIVPSVAKAVRILETLAASREPVSLADLARRLDMPKSTVRTLCTTLVQTRMALRAESGSYALGPHVVDLSRAYLARIDLAAEFSRICDTLPQLAAHTLVLSVLDGRDVVYVARRHGTRPLTLDYRLGMRLPASCTAGGKAMLSRLPDGKVARLFPGPDLPTLTRHSITRLDTLQTELERIRQRGYAFDDEESADGVYSLAAVVPDVDGEGAAAAVGVSLAQGARDNAHDLTPESIVDLAQLLAERLGGPASARGVAGQVRIWGRTAARPGDPMPELRMPSTSGALVDLAGLTRDRPLVLFFYPGDREGLRYPELAGCTTEAQAFRDNIDAITARGAAVYGVSLQSTPRQREFIRREHLPFDLLSDEQRELVAALGVPLWMSRLGEDYPSRTTVVVRGGGQIAAVLENVPAPDHPLAVLQALDAD